MTTRILSAVGLALLGSVSLGAEILPAWSQFRGADGTGISRTGSPPIRWSATENIRWQQVVPGHGWSSPVVRDQRIFLTSAILDDRERPISLRVLCYQVDSGKQLWAKDVISLEGNPYKHAKNSYASPTPIVAENRVYAHFGQFGTVCLDYQGKILWEQNSLGYEPVHGNGSSPILVDDKLIYSADGREDPSLYALNRDTGELVWKQIRRTDATRKFSFSTPSVFSIDGQTQIVSPASGAVFAYAPEDGREIWRVDYGQGYSVVPRPLYAHGHFFVATGFQRPSLLAIRSGGQGNITETHVTWQSTRGVPLTPTMLVFGEELYYVSDGGLVSCVDAKTGRRHWQDRVRGNVSSSPIVAAERLYVATEEGRMAVLRTGKVFETLAINEFGERIFATPAVTGDALIVRTESRLYCISEQ